MTIAEVLDGCEGLAVMADMQAHARLNLVTKPKPGAK